jgi:hypothetical protein
MEERSFSPLDSDWQGIVVPSSNGNRRLTLAEEEAENDDAQNRGGVIRG